MQKVKEKIILGYLVELLEKAQIPYSRNVHIRLIKKDGQFRPVKLRESQKGKPDLFVFCLNGKMVAVETKSPDGVLSEEQVRWRDLLEKRGYDYYAPFTVGEAEVIGNCLLRIGR